jgi:predicted enzyme related to lactoylglutathione lyase
MVAAGAAALPGVLAHAQPALAQPTAAPRVMMLRLYVADVDRGEKFYHAVFGTTVVQRMGDNVRIMIFPGGTMPGIIMIKSADEATMNGSFVMQVPDLKATLERAAANGGTLMATNFAQQVQGMAARSSHFIDPDGNIIEVLQMGPSK